MPTRIRETQDGGLEVRIDTDQLEALIVDGQVVRWHQRAQGLGDVAAKLAKRMRIKHCGGCERRRRWMNKLAPMRGRKKTRPGKPGPRQGASARRLR